GAHADRWFGRRPPSDPPYPMSRPLRANRHHTATTTPHHSTAQRRRTFVIASPSQRSDVHGDGGLHVVLARTHEAQQRQVELELCLLALERRPLGVRPRRHLRVLRHVLRGGGRSVFRGAAGARPAAALVARGGCGGGGGGTSSGAVFVC